MNTVGSKYRKVLIAFYWIGVIAAAILFIKAVYDSVLNKTARITLMDWLYLIGCPVIIILILMAIRGKAIHEKSS